MSQNFISDVNSFIKERKTVIFFIIFFLFAGYGFKVFNFTITLDNDWNIIMASEKPFSNVDFFFYGNGRYISGFLRSIFSINGAFVPFISAFMAVVFLGLSAIVICVIIDKLLETKVYNVSYICFTAIYLTVPLLYSQNFAFDLSVDIDYSMTLIITIIAYFLTFKCKIKSITFIFCSIITGFAFNVSQSRVVLYLSLYFGILLLYLIDREEVSFKKIFSLSHPFIICGVNGLIGYLLITKIGSLIMNVQYEYIEGMIGWTNGQGIHTGLINIAYSIKKIFWCKDPYGATYNFITLIIFIILIFQIILKRHKKTRIHCIYILCTFILFIISNFSLCIVLGNNMPYRTFVGLPIFLGFAWFLAIQEYRNIRIINIMVMLFFIIIFSKQVLLLNTYFYSSYQAAELEKIYAIEIANDIIKKNDGELPIKPVIFIGDYEVSTPQSVRLEGVGSTMLNWYEPIRKYNIMKVYGYRFNESLMDSAEANEKAEIIALDMPNWPAEDSIFIDDEMIVVKLSGSRIVELSYRQDFDMIVHDINNGQDMNIYINELSFKDNMLTIYGWCYLYGLNSEYTSMKITFISDTNYYIMTIPKQKRTDIENKFNPLLNGYYNYSGINEQVLLNTMKSGEYDVHLILENGEKRIYYPLGNQISINGRE